MKVVVDYGLCESNGVCAGIAADIFDLGEDDQLTVLQEHPPATKQALLEDAARQCPRQAIVIEV